MTPPQDLDRRLRDKALRCLSQREHSRAELRRKLLVDARRLSALGDSAPTRRSSAHRPALGAPHDGGSAAGADARSRRQGAGGSERLCGAGGDSADDAGGEGEGMALSAARVDRLLDRLQAQGLIDDRRFVESRVNQRQAGWGLRRLQGELDRHRLKLDPGSRQTLAATERDRAQALWQRKFGAVPTDQQQAQRQMRFLASRGFDGEVVRSVVPQVANHAVSEARSEPEHADSPKATPQPQWPCPAFNRWPARKSR